MAEFRMPSLGAGMDTGKLLEWYVAPGDEVERGQIVALVETDKAEIEVEVFHDGVVDELVVDEGMKVPVGTVLARLRDPTSGAAATSAPGAASPRRSEGDDPRRGAAATAERPRPQPEVHVQSPLVRRVAAREHVDLTTVVGTGPAGLVTRADVLEAARPTGAHDSAPVVGARSDRPPSSPYARRLARTRGLDVASLAGTGPSGAIVARDVPDQPGAGPSDGRSDGPSDRPSTEASAMRQAIARAMEQSNREIPQYHLGQWVDVEHTLEWLAATNAERAPAERILAAALVLKATALACRAHPELNGHWLDGGFQPGGGVHVGVAISLRGGGLVAPAIHDTDQLAVEEVMAALSDLVRRARIGRLRGSELTAPTITVTNLGDRGVDTVYGLVHPPQVALVGTGRVTQRAVVVDESVMVRRALHLSLAADHRASDGHLGGRFLTTLQRHLQEPEAL